MMDLRNCNDSDEPNLADAPPLTKRRLPVRLAKGIAGGFRKRATKKNALRTGIGALVAGLLYPGGLLYNYVGPHQVALRTTFGGVSSKGVQGPGLYFYVPFAQYTHDYNTQVQRIGLTAGGNRFLPLGDSTNDQNLLMSEVVINYVILPDAEKLGYHRWAMDGFFLQDGYWRLTRMMNDSANAIMGSQKISEVFSDSGKYTQEFLDDLSFRLEQNNMPVRIESAELKGFKTFWPTKSTSYEKISNPAP